MKQTNNLKEIGALFTKQGYIISDNGFKQYNPNTNTFNNIPTSQVMEIFNKLFINFERVPITPKLLVEHIPTITDNDFKTYELCKEIETNNLKDKINQKIKQLIETNNKKKLNISSIIIANDFKKQIQFLINNDILTNGKHFFKVEDTTIKMILPDTIRQIIQPHIKEVTAPFDFNKLILFSTHQLTKINIDYIKLNQMQNLTEQDWQTYYKIKKLLETYRQ